METSHLNEIISKMTSEEKLVYESILKFQEETTVILNNAKGEFALSHTKKALLEIKKQLNNLFENVISRDVYNTKLVLIDDSYFLNDVPYTGIAYQVFKGQTEEYYSELEEARKNNTLNYSIVAFKFNEGYYNYQIPDGLIKYVEDADKYYFYKGEDLVVFNIGCEEPYAILVNKHKTMLKVYNEALSVVSYFINSENKIPERMLGKFKICFI